MNCVDGDAANLDDSVSPLRAEEVSPEAVEKKSMVRLIVQRPLDGAVLLRRFWTVDENGHDGFELPSYWSFKGLRNLKRLQGEKNILDVVNRVAHRQLGIEIHDLSLIMPVYNTAAEPPILQRAYLHTRDWSGELRADCNPDTHQGSLPSHEQGVHTWCLPQFLGTYLFHPEVVKATRKAEELVNMLSYKKPKKDEASGQQE